MPSITWSARAFIGGFEGSAAHAPAVAIAMTSTTAEERTRSMLPSFSPTDEKVRAPRRAVKERIGFATVVRTLRGCAAGPGGNTVAVLPWNRGSGGPPVPRWEGLMRNRQTTLRTIAAVGGAATSYSAIARGCPEGNTCSASSDAGWGPWSHLAGPGGNTFTVVP